MADEKPAEAAPAIAAAAPAGGGGGKLTMILTLVNLVATMGMIGMMLVSFKKDRQKPQIEDLAHSGGEEAAGKDVEKGKDGKEKEAKKSLEAFKMVSLEQFTVNLSTPGSVNPKFVRVNVAIRVPNADAETELNSKMPQVRNAIIDLFNSKRPNDLATVEGREYLKEEIKNALNGFMITGKVEGIFFTNFALSS
ncbi:MAG: flagellar basal body-associated FliL family protein [Bdellovibrionales bacterium]|nr:flagellar basal body-associated FliL family protein [Bdellovibrionales bacterium]